MITMGQRGIVAPTKKRIPKSYFLIQISAPQKIGFYVIRRTRYSRLVEGDSGDAHEVRWQLEYHEHGGVSLQLGVSAGEMFFSGVGISQSMALPDATQLIGASERLLLHFWGVPATRTWLAAQKALRIALLWFWLLSERRSGVALGF